MLHEALQQYLQGVETKIVSLKNVYVTPHFADLSIFSHHKHLKDDVIACDKPEINAVITKVLALLSNGV